MVINESLKQTPTISEEVYKSLPELIKNCVELFEAREKDVILTSILTMLSGCYSKLRGRYSSDNVGPNLYTFIIAPPASGKGVMKYAKQLGQPIQNAYLQDRNLKISEYEQEKKKLGKDKEAITALNRPKNPVLFIPGNSSSAAVYSILNDNKGTAIMVETEADTVSNTIMQDWGNFSDIFRKAFHHEAISQSRKTGGEYIEIAQPHLSVLLSGTPSQVTKLITSAEDGLSSRFLYYTYESNWEWKDPTPCKKCPDFEKYFYDTGKKVAKIHKTLESGLYSFTLSKRQFTKLSNAFEAKTSTLKRLNAVTARSTINRLALICFRIAMILTVTRKMDILPNLTELNCDEIDLDTALELCDVYFEHALVIHQMLPQHSKVAIPTQLATFLEMLPCGVVFSRKDADEIGFQLGISKRTVGTYLEKLCNQVLICSPKYGKYAIVERID